MKTKLIICCFWLATCTLISCEKEKDYPATTFEIIALDEQGNPFIDSLTISAEWGTPIYRAGRSGLKTIKFDQKGMGSASLPIKMLTFNFSLTYPNYSKIGLIKSSNLKTVLTYDSIFDVGYLTFDRSQLKTGKVNRIELVKVAQ